ncbi:hypothetical protein [uncultured Corynebacterium sp.]|uniref:hypothetical protein n=1 Tax=uncultured Corynebacterium sp. TaxID=159447 RepID=UPI00259502C2|nr:hypothetical protein [uncultured Corynebacterium sp.]
MSTIDKAAQVIAEHDADGVCDEPECIVKDLKYAGLLAPDLPEPESALSDPDEAWWNITDGHGIHVGHVWAYAKYQSIDLMLPEKLTELTPAQARDLADKLRAAAEHAERYEG